MSLRHDAARQRNTGLIALACATVIFVLPFLYIFHMAVNTMQEAALLLITVGAVTQPVMSGSVVGYVLQRRTSGWNRLICACILIGLMVPPPWCPRSGF